MVTYQMERYLDVVDGALEAWQLRNLSHEAANAVWNTFMVPVEHALGSGRNNARIWYEQGLTDTCRMNNWERRMFARCERLCFIFRGLVEAAQLAQAHAGTNYIMHYGKPVAIDPIA